VRPPVLLIVLLLSAYSHAQTDGEILVTRAQSGGADPEADFNVPLRESDFRAAFSILDRSDKMLPICFNSAMGSAIRFRFIREQSEHGVQVLTSSCRIDGRGLWCEPLDATQRYYFASPESPVELDAEVSYGDAEILFQAYGENGIAEMPDRYKGFTRDKITRIERLPDSIRLTVGDYLCTHCVTQFDVQLQSDGENNLLRLHSPPEGGCK